MSTLQLQPRFKRLKLGGMLQTIELRLDQAHQEKLGHLEFLELMLEDEIQRRQNKALQRRIQRARFEEAATLSDFDYAFNPKIPASQIRDLATCGFIEDRERIAAQAALPGGVEMPGAEVGKHARGLVEEHARGLVEEHAPALHARGVTDGLGDMGLADADRTDEQHRLAPLASPSATFIELGRFGWG